MREPPNNFRSRIDKGTAAINVMLWDLVNPQDEAQKVANFYRSTWDSLYQDIERVRAPEDWQTAQDAMSGKVLPNCLEAVKLTFGIEGVSRASTHQLVRSRVGVGFGQQGGRDNNWSDFNFRRPTTWNNTSIDLVRRTDELVQELDILYQDLLANGVPFQDARYILPMGLETALVGTYNLLALKGTLQRRLCNRMMWETNFIARRMADETVRALPWVGKNLRSSCETKGVCASVSPMFPPSCLTPHSGEPNARLAADNIILQEQMDGAGYDWPYDANGCTLDFEQTDRERLATEYNHPDIVVSLTDGTTVLARRDGGGMWRSSNGQG